jgi:hypothetical protein
VVDDLYIDERSQRIIDANVKELLEERESAQLALDAAAGKAQEAEPAATGNGQA